MLGEKRRVMKSFLCHSCMNLKHSMESASSSRRRKLSVTKKCILMFNFEISIHSNVVEKIKQKSILSILPVFLTFSLLKLQKCVKIYSIFRFEPMHVLLLGVSKTF